MPVVADIAGFPAFEVEFTKDGTIFRQDDKSEAVRFVSDRGLTDLFVFSHGWNNDIQDARDLARRFFAKVKAVRRKVAGLGDRAFGVVVVLWPSKKFAEEEFIAGGGAAAAGGMIRAKDVKAHIDRLRGVFDDPQADEALEKAKALVARLDDSPRARVEFVDLVRSVLPKPKKARKGSEDGTSEFLTMKGDELMNRLKGPILLPARPPRHRSSASVAQPVGGTAAGLIGDVVSGMKAAARRVLNFTTYYQMKERAGIVGLGGVYQVLQAIRDRAPTVKLHLIGHSFGGRLVSAAALGPPGRKPIKPETMTLIQAAFSHYGFAHRYDDKNDGFFRKVITQSRVSGPILITHTANDLAVGYLYSWSSTFMGQAGAGITGGSEDFYGGIGRNGAQKTPEASFGLLQKVGGSYAFGPGRPYNLQSDVIPSHNDICKDEVAYAILSAVTHV